MPGEQPEAVSRQRIDKWLFFARIAKSRTLAQEWVEGGHVSVNGEKVRRSSADVRVGDRLEVLAERRTYVVVVKDPGTRRGPYEEARLLYDDESPALAGAGALAPRRHPAQSGRLAGSGRWESGARPAAQPGSGRGRLNVAGRGLGFCRSGLQIVQGRSCPMLANPLQSR